MKNKMTELEEFMSLVKDIKSNYKNAEKRGKQFWSVAKAVLPSKVIHNIKFTFWYKVGDTGGKAMKGGKTFA